MSRRLAARCEMTLLPQNRRGFLGHRRRRLVDLLDQSLDLFAADRIDFNLRIQKLTEVYDTPPDIIAKTKAAAASQ